MVLTNFVCVDRIDLAFSSANARPAAP
jgi:hypothetical protein